MMGWRTLPFLDVADIFDGPHATPKTVDSGPVFLGISSLQDGNVVLEKTRHVTDEDYAKWTRRVEPRVDDIVFSYETRLGQAAIIPEGLKCCLGRRMGLIRIKNRKVLPKFVLYQYLSPEYQSFLSSMTLRGATVDRISIKEFPSFPINITSISEQQRIVAILDDAFERIDAAIANTENNLANARELFESYLNDVFVRKGEGWEEKTLAEVSIDFGRGKSKHRPRNDKKLYGGGYPFIQTGDVRNCDHIIDSYSQTYNEFGLSQSKLWPKGTICITIAANIAETGVLGFDSCFPDSVIGIVVDHEKTSNGYVEYLLQSVKAGIKKEGKGSAQDNINLKTFENKKFPFPPLAMQLEIVSKLDDLWEKTAILSENYQNKLSALTELKQSILQKVFSGEFTADINHEALEN